VAGRIISMKNSSDTIGNRTLELPACSLVPQQAAPTHAPFNILLPKIFQTYYVSNVSMESCAVSEWMSRIVTCGDFRQKVRDR
jgi:hypothetical protein